MLTISMLTNMTTQIKPASNNKKELISGFLLEKTAKMMKLHFSRALAVNQEIEITADQWIILDIVYNLEPISQQDLADQSMKDAPTVTRILDILENKQFLSRQAHPTDRRKFQIVLLEKGRELYDLVWPVVRNFRATCYQDISPEELEIFLSVLYKIQHHFQPQS